jgi:hypothetical protein
MKHLWKGAPALVLLAAIAAPTGNGCVQAESPFFIRSAKVLSCETTTADSDDLAAGVMDVRYSCNYTAFLELGNQLVRRGDPDKLQTETSRISVTSFDVEVLGVDGAQLSAFSLPATGFVDPGNGTEPGYGLSGTTLVDGKGALGARAQLQANQGGFITARLVAYGRTLGGDGVKTRPFDFPINVCDGCLCSVPADDDCVMAADTPKAACFIPQDAPFDCRFIGADCSTAGTCGVLQ